MFPRGKFRTCELEFVFRTGNKGEKTKLCRNPYLVLQNAQVRTYELEFCLETKFGARPEANARLRGKAARPVWCSGSCCVCGDIGLVESGVCCCFV